MKVYIGNYKNHLGPYQIAEWVPFLNEDQQDRLGHWLSHTWVNSFCDWLNKFRGDRTIKVRIDKYDTWCMDHTLAHIILPMLKQLKETKHGSPIVDDEDLPPHMRHSDPKTSEDGWDLGDNWIHYKWEWILNEMIFSFESLLDDSWENKFYHGTPTYVSELLYTDDCDNKFSTVNQVNPDYWVDYEGIKQYNDRINNGLRLFGKYYQHLWD